MNNEAEDSRERLALAIRDTRSSLDFPKRIQRSFRRQPAAWIIGAVLLGAVVVMMPRRKVVYISHDKKHHPKSKLLEAGFLMGAARIAATLLKPVLLNFVRERFINSPGRPNRSSWS